METEERILKAAEMLFRKQGYKGTSVRDISVAAKTSVSSVSYYFGGKEKLYKKIFPKSSPGKGPCKKDVILKAAVKLFAMKGYNSVSIRDIGKAAGVNSAAISYYFGGKKELYRDILEQGSSLLMEYVAEAARGNHSPEEIIHLYSRFFYKIMNQHPYVLRIFSWEMIHPTDVFASIGKERFAAVFTVLRGAITDGMERGVFRSDVRPTEACISWAGMVAYFYLMSELKKRFAVKEELSEADYVSQAYEVMMNGIRNHPGTKGEE